MLEVRDLVAEAAFEPVRRVLGPVPVEDLDVAVALEGQYMSCDAIQEKPVVRDDEHRPREAEDRLLQRAQRADVQVVRGLVEDEDLCWQRPVRQ